MDYYNTIEYLIPAYTVINFDIPSQERDLSIKLLAGTAQFQLDCTEVYLPLGQEYPFSSVQSLSPTLMSLSKCVFIFRGNHYVSHASTMRGTCNNLFVISPSGDSFVFVLENMMQLQIFVGEENSPVKLRAIRGSPGIFGSPLVRDKKYYLLPYSSVLVDSLDNDRYTINIEGKNRRIKVSLKEEIIWTFMKWTYDRILTLRKIAIDNERVGPTILVVGPPNVSKTSICYFLLNKAVENGMNPVYIDLDVRGNSNTIPGTVSLAEIKSQCHISKGFSKYVQNILQFGNTNIDSINIQFYYYLIRRMGELLTICQKDNTTNYYGAVIDLCGSLCQDNSTIDCVLESFKIDLVLAIGDKRYYDAVKNSVLTTKELKFIPQPHNIEPRDETRETKFRNIILRKYFYSKLRKPMEPDVFEVKLSDVKIYRVVFETANGTARDEIVYGFSLKPVACTPSIEYHLLGVSQAVKIDANSPVNTEVKYFVCFTKVDIEKEVVFVLSPESAPFSKEILIMQDIQMTPN